MKKITLVACAILIASFSGLNAAVTFSVANVTGSSSGPNGLPIVNNAGVPIATGGAFASIGYFTSTPDFATMSASSLLAIFAAVDSTPVDMLATRSGMFNGQDYNSATNVYPANFKGKTGFVVVGNNANLALSSAIAVFGLDTVFPDQDGANNATYAIALTSATSSVKYGIVKAVTVQPNPATTNPFVNGVQMTSIPEPSAALLGAFGVLGLLRRRRN